MLPIVILHFLVVRELRIFNSTELASGLICLLRKWSPWHLYLLHEVRLHRVFNLAEAFVEHLDLSRPQPRVLQQSAHFRFP